MCLVNEKLCVNKAELTELNLTPEKTHHLKINISLSLMIKHQHLNSLPMKKEDIGLGRVRVLPLMISKKMLKEEPMNLN